MAAKLFCKFTKSSALNPSDNILHVLSLFQVILHLFEHHCQHHLTSAKPTSPNNVGSCCVHMRWACCLFLFFLFLYFWIYTLVFIITGIIDLYARILILHLSTEIRWKNGGGVNQADGNENGKCYNNNDLLNVQTVWACMHMHVL